MSTLTPRFFSHSLPPSILCTLYIPRPTKLLLQHDDSWSRYLDKHGDTLSDWTKLAVERMLACGTCLMGVRRYCCASSDCTHARFFCQSCKSKACTGDLPCLGHIRNEDRWYRYLHAQYLRAWEVHFAKKNRGRGAA